MRLKFAEILVSSVIGTALVEIDKVVMGSDGQLGSIRAVTHDFDPLLWLRHLANDIVEIDRLRVLEIAIEAFNMAD